MSRNMKGDRRKGKRISGGPSAEDLIRNLMGSAALVDRVGEVDASVRRVMRGIESYKRSLFLVEKSGVRRRPGKGSASAGLLTIKKKVDALLGEVRNFDPSALQEFCREYGPRGRLTSMLEGTQNELEIALGAIDRANERVAGLKDNPEDGELLLLIVRIGNELRNIGARVSLSDDDGRVTGARGGATWAKVVNASLASIGINHKVSKYQLRRAKQELDRQVT